MNNNVGNWSFSRFFKFNLHTVTYLNNGSNFKSLNRQFQYFKLGKSLKL